MKSSMKASFEVDLDITKLTADTHKPETSVTEPMTMNVLADGAGYVIMKGMVGVRFSIEVNKVAVDVDIASYVISWASLEGTISEDAKSDPKWPDAELFEANNICTKSTAKSTSKNLDI